MNNFETLGLHKGLMKTVRGLGFDQPTPIQLKAIPIVLDGRDVLGLAQTGTGKTAAFGLPLVQNLSKTKIRPQPKMARALILAPTRELVTQIGENMRAYVKGTKLRVQMIVGGLSINTQRRNLALGADIVVATPGRLLDLMERDALTLKETRFLVLDEADQMLDLGFIHTLRRIAGHVNPDRQTLLFSATMPKQIETLSKTFQNDPLRVQAVPPGRAADKINQSVHFVSARGKADLLKTCLAERPDDVSLVFARTKHGAEKLMKHLVAHGFKAGSVHGNKSQNQRDKAIKAFKAGELSILVATDVAARGIDISGVTHVYNYQLPEVPETYVHRIGRTARAGADGAAIAFCAPDEVKLLRAVEKLMDRDVLVVGGTPYDQVEQNEAVDDSVTPRRKRTTHRKGYNKKRNTGRKSASAVKPKFQKTGSVSKGRHKKSTPQQRTRQTNRAQRA